jgi:hypothetical protein
MSHPLISRSDDLRRLRDEGYEVSILSGHLLVEHVPYVGVDKKVRFGTLVSDLTLAGDQTTTPANHVAYFVGDQPCDSTGRPLTKLILDGQSPYPVGSGVTATWWFSSKPIAPARYEDYHQKMTTYVAALSGHAEGLDPTATARTFRVVDAAEDDVFVYHDTASSRAGIGAISQALRTGPVAVIGLGGTGAYLLDFLAKTPAAEIHLFDPDTFLQHNAFRSPGAATIEQLQSQPTKVDYLASAYAAMRRTIIPHSIAVTADNLELLDGMQFVFIAIDNGPAKAPIIDHLERRGIPFVDVGMGLYSTESRIGGIVRSTLSTDRPGSRAAARGRISTNDAGPGEYNTNIQIAELNALNAALAIVQYKKHLGFYDDADDSHFAGYVIDANSIVNEDGAA